MSIVQINHHPSKKQLNQFGFIWLGFMSFFGAIAWFKLGAPAVAKVVWIAAVVVPIIGWILPSFMRLVFVGMSYAAWPVGMVVSHVVLALVYYLVITPIGLLMRIFGYDPMTQKPNRTDRSRWVERTENDRGPESYFRQF